MAAVLWHFGIPTFVLQPDGVSRREAATPHNSPPAPRTLPCGVLLDIVSPPAPPPPPLRQPDAAAGGSDAAVAAAEAPPPLPWALTVHYRNVPAGLAPAWCNAGSVREQYFNSLKVRLAADGCTVCGGATRCQCGSSTVGHIPQSAICTVRHCRVACQEMRSAASCMPTRIHHNTTPAGGVVHMPRLRGRRRGDAAGGGGAGRAVARCGSGAGPWGNLRLGGAARGAGRGELLSELQQCCRAHRNLAARLLLALTAKQVQKTNETCHLQPPTAARRRALLACTDIHRRCGGRRAARCELHMQTTAREQALRHLLRPAACARLPPDWSLRQSRR